MSSNSQPSAPSDALISPATFDAVCDLLQRLSGIPMAVESRALVTGRLYKLAQARGLTDVDAYVAQLLRDNDPAELAKVVDRLSSNETCFFREPEHFRLLASLASAHGAAQPYRVWSAASASGEEAYSIAMVLADKLQQRHWEVVGTDLSTALLTQARTGLYPMARARAVPGDYLKRFCRKGQGEYAGQMLVARELRHHVRFGQANLTEALPRIGMFDVVFLRHVLVHFDTAGQADIVQRVVQRLKPGGLLFIGQAESLNSLNLPLRTIQPAVYTRA